MYSGERRKSKQLWVKLCRESEYRFLLRNQTHKCEALIQECTKPAYVYQPPSRQLEGGKPRTLTLCKDTLTQDYEIRDGVYGMGI